jgi:hypothetical protein
VTISIFRLEKREELLRDHARDHGDEWLAIEDNQLWVGVLAWSRQGHDLNHESSVG